VAATRHLASGLQGAAGFSRRLQPRRILEATGLKVVQMEGLIEEGLSAVFAGQPVPARHGRQFKGCSMGVSCKGDGMGCG